MKDKSKKIRLLYNSSRMLGGHQSAWMWTELLLLLFARSTEKAREKSADLACRQLRDSVQPIRNMRAIQCYNSYEQHRSIDAHTAPAISKVKFKQEYTSDIIHRSSVAIKFTKHVACQNTKCHSMSRQSIHTQSWARV